GTYFNEKKYPLRKKVLLQILELKLESEEDSTMALELIRFVKKLVAELEPEDSDGDEEDLLGFTNLMRQKNETRRTNSALWDSRRLEVKQ
ncbi:hypothetical protein Tco_0147859, partial [Tanacetum coccineum]